MVIEVTAQQVFNAAGWIIGGSIASTAAVVTVFHTLRRWLGQNRFQMSAGETIKATLKMAEKQEVIIHDIKTHMDNEKEVWKRLLNYAEDSAKNNFAMVKLLEKYVTNK